MTIDELNDIWERLDGACIALLKLGKPTEPNRNRPHADRLLLERDRDLYERLTRRRSEVHRLIQDKQREMET